MKTSHPVALAALVASLVGIPADGQTVYSKPAGFVKLGDVTPNEPSVPPQTDVRVAIPLERETSFAGTYASSTAYVPPDPGPEAFATLTVEDAPGWDASANGGEGEWAASGGTPYCVVVTSGVEEGLRALIQSNTADTLTIEQTTEGQLQNIGIGDTLAIRPCWTLKSFFAESDIPAGTWAFLFEGDTSGKFISPDIVAIYNGSSWVYISEDGIADGLILHPGESFIIRSGVNPIATLSVFGNVPMENHRARITKWESDLAQDTTIGFTSPVPTPIGLSGLGFTPGDLFMHYSDAPGTNKSPAGVLIYNGEGWVDLFSDDGVVDESFMIQPGKGYLYRQHQDGPQGVADWKADVTYPTD